MQEVNEEESMEWVIRKEGCIVYSRTVDQVQEQGVVCAVEELRGKE